MLLYLPQSPVKSGYHTKFNYHCISSVSAWWYCYYIRWCHNIKIGFVGLFLGRGAGPPWSYNAPSSSTLHLKLSWNVSLFSATEHLDHLTMYFRTEQRTNYWRVSKQPEHNRLQRSNLLKQIIWQLDFALCSALYFGLNMWRAMVHSVMSHLLKRFPLMLFLCLAQFCLGLSLKL